MKYGDLKWHILPNYLPANLWDDEDGKQGASVVIIAFAFDGDELLWLSARGTVLYRRNVSVDVSNKLVYGRL